MKHLTLLIPAFLLLGCAPEPAPDVSRAAGQMLFAENCAACHGADGTGGGPAAAGLSTAPADLTKMASRRDGVWPVLEVMSILDGYTKRTNPREDMPIVSGLTEGPTVNFDNGNGVPVPTSARLVAVANYLQSIQNPAPTSTVP